MHLEHTQQHLRAILEEMPAVGDLERCGSTVAGTLGIDTSAVAADHLHAGMLLEPLGEARC
jgi:hypothetical protein